VAIGSQVGRYPLGLMGNGYLPIPSGGVSEVLLGEGSWLEVDRLSDPTPALPLH
jgi:hypothetical protein